MANKEETGNFHANPELASEEMKDLPPTFKLPRMSLLKNYKRPCIKDPKYFTNYDDVISKPAAKLSRRDSAKRSLRDIANSKDNVWKMGDWKIQQFIQQLQILADDEKEYKAVIESVAKVAHEHLSNDDEESKKCLNMLDGLIQRSTYISENLYINSTIAGKSVDHKVRIKNMLNRFATDKDE